MFVIVKISPEESIKTIVENKNQQINKYVEELKQGKWKIKFNEMIQKFKKKSMYHKIIDRPPTPDLMEILGSNNSTYEEAEFQLR